MAARTIRITAREAAALPLPAAGYVDYQDAEVRHLVLRIAATGRRSWHYLAFQRGAARRQAVGVFPAVSPALAREAVLRLDLEWSTGVAGSLARSRAPRAAATLGQVWQEYLAAAELRLRPATLRLKRGVWSLHLSAWAGLPAAALSRVQVAELHDRLGRAGHPAMANKALHTLRALYSWALDRDLVQGRNPAARIALFAEPSRERFLRREEASRLLAAVRAPQTPERLRHLVLLCLATGQRRGNVLGMRWDEVDAAGATWSIPGASAKAGKPLAVPLLPLALEVLRARRAAAAPGCPWVFPGYGAARGTRPWGDPKHAWRELVQRAGLPGLRLHDLRRTLGSWMAIGNVSTAIIGRALGHTDAHATAVYARLTADPVAAAMQAALGAMGGDDAPRP